MGWYSDAVDALTDDGSDANKFLSSNLVSGIAQGAVSKQLSNYFQPDIPQIGYQGTVPELQAVRERVPMQQPAQGEAPRRPGSGGRRYFSDVQYAERPEGEAKSVAEAQAIAKAQAELLARRNKSPVTNQQPIYDPQGGPQQAVGMAAGGVASAYNRRHNGYYLGGKTDGMADEVPASIDGTQEARLSDGEFVIPADVVSHLGNGNSDAGADQLHSMMDNVRMERTGNSEQGKQIDPNKFMPNMAQGGIAQAYNYGGSVYKNQGQGKTNFYGAGNQAVVGQGSAANSNAATGVGGDTTTDVDPNVGAFAGYENSLSNYAGDYVTDMLGQGKALGNQAYQGYEGPLSAGTSAIQDQAFTGIGNLQAPTGMGAFTPQTFGADQAQQYMNPYLMQSLNPQIDEARRQNEIDRIANAGRMTKAGAYGGSRQAIMDMEGQRNLQSNIADITGQGYANAYDRAQQQFNTEQGLGMQAQTMANQYGFDVLGGQGTAGATQRAQVQQGLSADQMAFEEERDFPYKQVQYMQSLLQGLPLEAQSYSYSQPSDIQKILGSTAGVQNLIDSLYGSGNTNPAGESVITDPNTGDGYNAAPDSDGDGIPDYLEGSGT